MDTKNEDEFFLCLTVSENSSLLGCESKIKAFYEELQKSSTNQPCESMKSEAASCENSILHKILLGYCFPLILTVCLVGNCANIFTYHAKYLRKSTTVKMLTAKAVMNTVFMVCLLPHFFLLTFDGMSTSSSFEFHLWTIWPYMLFLANVAGTCATWLTVFMTLETYVLVAWPHHSKKWCTTRNFVAVLICILLIAMFLHVPIPVTKFVKAVPCGSSGESYIHRLTARNGTAFYAWDSVHYWANLVVALAAPNAILVVITARLVHKLMFCSLPNYSESKMCVTRITLATTACQLTLEAPSVIVYAVAALHGPTFINQDPVMCLCHVLTNFASQLNASICFVIYLLCSSKFRQLLLHPTCCKSPGTTNGYERMRRSQQTTTMNFTLNDIPMMHMNIM